MINAKSSVLFERKVDTVVEREWNIALLVRALNSSGFLNRVYGGFPAFRYRKLGIAPSQLRTFPLAALWNRVTQKAHLPKGFQLSEPKWVGNWVSSHRDLARVVTCNGTAYRHLFPRLVKRGHILVVERGSMFPEDHVIFKERAKKEAGFPYTESLPASLRDEMEKSKLAHFIAVGSEMIAQSYIKRGYASERILRCQYGIDADRFAFFKRPLPPAGRPLRIVSVGVVGLRKGIFRLIKMNEWARNRGIALEFHLVGPVEAEAASLLAKTSAPFTLHGVQKGQALVDTLHQCDLYAMCSYEEGFPLSLLEAMSTGLPAIVSNDTGAREAITIGKDGVIIEDFSTEEFDKIMAPLFSMPAGFSRMSVAAREKVEQNYTLHHYARRIRSEYSRMFELIDAAAGAPLPPACQSEEGQ